MYNSKLFVPPCMNNGDCNNKIINYMEPGKPITKKQAHANILAKKSNTKHRYVVVCENGTNVVKSSIIFVDTKLNKQIRGEFLLDLCRTIDKNITYDDFEGFVIELIEHVREQPGSLDDGLTTDAIRKFISYDTNKIEKHFDIIVQKFDKSSAFYTVRGNCIRYIDGILKVRPFASIRREITLYLNLLY